jgi:toxin ParE1/3/4
VTRKFEIQWTASAQADLDEILEYVASRDSYVAANGLHDKLIRRIETLGAHPLRCRIIPELRAVGVLDFRELILPPYRVCFRIHGKEVVLLGVLDGRRDLGELLLRRAWLPWQRGAGPQPL